MVYYLEINGQIVIENSYYFDQLYLIGLYLLGKFLWFLIWLIYASPLIFSFIVFYLLARVLIKLVRVFIE